MKAFRYITDDSMNILVNLCQNKLEHLEIIDVPDVSDAGVREVTRLSKLKKLHLENLSHVKEPAKVLQELRSSLPGCDIKWPPYTEEASKEES